MDLYANEWQTFWRVTFPLVFPGILAAALLSFSLSFDDFIITNLNAGQTVTFPMFVWGAAQRGIPPQINVIGTVMFLLALTLVLGRRAGQPPAGDGADALTRSPAGTSRPAQHSPTPRRRRTGSTTRRGRTRRRRSTRHGTPTWSSSAAATAACGPRCSPRSAIPAATCVLLEAGTCGWAATGRNGGFCAASLTHGFGNGLDALARRAGRRCDGSGSGNLDAIEETVADHGIDCDFERTGELERRHRAAPGRGAARAGTARCRPRGHDGRRCSTPDGVRAQVDSPTYLGALCDPTAPPWSSRPGWPGACGRPAWTLGVRIVRGHAGAGPAPARRRGDELCAPPTGDRAGGPGRCSPPTPSRRCCAGCG